MSRSRYRAHPLVLRCVQVRAVTDGQYAIEAIAERTPDVVLSVLLWTLLAGIGIQASGWNGVPAPHLYRITAALRATGEDA